MPKPTDKERVGALQKRINSAEKEHYDWTQEYDCDESEQFYYGHQWMNESEEWDKRKYVINLFFPAINISKSSLLFSTPKFKVAPRPVHMNDPLSNIEVRAKLQEDTLNSYVTDPKIGFETETGLGVLDAQFRFGVAYVGYSADSIDNPQAGKPVLNDNQEPLLDGDGKEVAQPAKSIRSEQLFLEWIPASTFRVSKNAPNRLTSCDWCGYYKWLRVEDIKANPRYKNTSGILPTGKPKDASAGSSDSDQDKASDGLVQVWFIWDNRAKKKFVFAQGGEKFFLEEDFKFLPFAVLKFNERLGKFYPLPEAYNWIHPQRELNDTREMQRIHRKRAVRRYRRKPSVTQTEFDKLANGEDMVCIETANENDITPILDAPLDAAVSRNIPQTQDDFTRVSGISGEAQQVAQSETATQANLIALANQTRESSRRMVVAKWLAEIGRIMLLTLDDKMSLPLWIKRNVDPQSPFAKQEAQEISMIWQQISAQDLGDIDNDISVEISSLSPIAQKQEREDMLGLITIMKDPILGAVISQSPYLLRKIAGSFNITNERELREISQAMQGAALMQAMMMQQQAGAKGPGGGTGPGPTPTNAAIGGQLQAQLPVEVGQG